MANDFSPRNPAPATSPKSIRQRRRSPAASTPAAIPRGLAVAPRRNLLLAADWGLDQLAVIDLASGETKARIPVGRQPTTVAITPDESLALVSNLIPATAATAPDHATEVSVIDLQTLKAKPAIRLPLGSTNARGIAISGDGRTAYVVHALGRFNLPTTQLDRGWVNTNALSIIDLPSNKLTATVLLDQVMDGAADPWGIALDPSGMRLFVTLSGVHQLAVIDLERLPEILKQSPESLINDLAALHRHNLIRRIDLPAQGPRGLAISPDGKLLAIAGYFSGNVVLTRQQRRQSRRDPARPAAGTRSRPARAKSLFHDAGRCFQRWLSCATCHPDARADGLNWDLLNDGLGNPKNTRSMLLERPHPAGHVARRPRHHGGRRPRRLRPHPVHRTQGRRTCKPSSPTSSPSNPSSAPTARQTASLTESARAARNSSTTRRSAASNCHPGPLFTDLAMTDVGTTRPLDRGAKRFDTPTLVELWRTPPYLHDGSATTAPRSPHRPQPRRPARRAPPASTPPKSTTSSPTCSRSNITSLLPP